MATLLTINDITKPCDFGWNTVQNKKKSPMVKEKEIDTSKLKKTKITITLRVPSDKAADYSAAEVHIATLRELGKQDGNLIVLDSSGNKHVNIHKSFGHDAYKEMFKPREKIFPNGGGQVSVAHYVLSEISSFNKTLMIPFLRANKAFIYFNQREGLEHFTAIGVMFGPHPDYTWRQKITDSLENTILADLSPDEAKTLSNSSSKPKIVVQLTPQQISNNKYSKVTSIALEVRVPAEHERVYLEILDRLNERASQLKDGEVDLVLDERIGTFFPYYAKAERPKLFEKLMKKQNAEMASVSVIPIFGYTQNAMNQLVKNGNDESTLHSAIRSHPNILKIEQTASTITLGKYLVIFERYMRDDVELYMDELFEQIPDLPEQPMNFTKPQRGGNAFKKARVNNISTFLSRLEQKIDDEHISYADDDEASTPPPRPRRFTISYAQATKRLSFNKETVLYPPTNTVHTTTTATPASTLTQESLEESLNRIRQDTEQKLNSFRNEIRQEFGSIEDKIVAAVVKAVTPAQEIDTNDSAMTDANSNMTTAQDSQTVSTLTDKVDNLMIIVTEMMQQFRKFQEDRENSYDRDSAKRNRNTPPTPTRLNNTSSDDQVNRSPPNKLARPGTPHSTPKTSQGHPIQQLTEGARGAS
jgi:hypothetical protein